MSSTYTPNPAHTPATSTMPSDGDALNVASIIGAIKDALDLAANARLNAAKTNVENNFSAKQTMAQLEVLGVALFDAIISSKTPDSFTATRVPIQFVGSGVNGHPVFYVYMANTDTIEFVFNATWDEGAGQWNRDHTLGRTTRFAFSKSGLVVQSYNGASDAITESDWTFVMDMTLPTSGSKGRVLGSSANGTVGFLSSDIRETPKVVGVDVAFGADWTENPVSGARPTGFWKDTHGVVHLEGLPQKTSGTAAVSTIFTLPAGYRPSQKVTFQDDMITNALVADLVIDTNGNVISNKAIVSQSVRLEGLTFRAS